MSDRAFMADVPEECPICGGPKMLAWCLMSEPGETGIERHVLVCAACSRHLRIHTIYKVQVGWVLRDPRTLPANSPGH